MSFKLLASKVRKIQAPKNLKEDTAGGGTGAIDVLGISEPKQKKIPI